MWLETAQTELVSKRGGPALLGAFWVHSHELGQHPAAAFSGKGVLVPAPGDVQPPPALALGGTQAVAAPCAGEQSHVHLGVEVQRNPGWVGFPWAPKDGGRLLPSASTALPLSPRRIHPD